MSCQFKKGVCHDFGYLLKLLLRLDLGFGAQMVTFFNLIPDFFMIDFQFFNVYFDVHHSHVYIILHEYLALAHAVILGKK